MSEGQFLSYPEEHYVMCFFPWEPVPWWHPKRWFGDDQRRQVRDFICGGDYYEYGRSQDIARDALHALYAPHGTPRRGG
jgi:hypothetical protein